MRERSVLLPFGEERRALNIQHLRQQTEADHLAVEGSIPLMHDALTRDEYVHCLRQLYGIVAAWEERAAQAAPDWLQPLLAARSRRDLLLRDLAWLGATAPETPWPILPAMDALPALLGSMYVMEGSTLGGQFIARHVEARLGLSEGHGNAFFRGHGEQTGAMWKEFCAVLTAKVSDEQAPAAIASAKAMFTSFGAWMREMRADDH